MQRDGNAWHVFSQEDILIISGRYNWTAGIRKPQSKMFLNKQLILMDLKDEGSPDRPPVTAAHFQTLLMSNI